MLFSSHCLTAIAEMGKSTRFGLILVAAKESPFAVPAKELNHLEQ
jgi:hypothetical protein